MLVRRISPAPISTPLTAQSTASSSVGLRPPWVNTRQRGSGPGSNLASIARTMHWEPKRSDVSRISPGSAIAAVFRETLSAPALSIAPMSSAEREGHEAALRRRRHDVAHDPPPVARGRDVEEDELVGPLCVVGGRALDRVARVAQLLEPHALHDPPRCDVEAGDDPARKHQPSSRAISGSKLTASRYTWPGLMMSGWSLIRYWR